ncbi:MAG: ABC transporter permease [Cellvibrionales bacterium]|nr:ABC transporter permease [Cellvibrionales bacterium]
MTTKQTSAKTLEPPKMDEKEFLPYKGRTPDIIQRPSRNYWQQAFSKLKTNPSALISLLIIIALVVFTLIGDKIWTVDPYDQDLTQISSPPSFNKKALVIPDKIHYQPIIQPSKEEYTLKTTSSGMSVIGTPTTQFIAFKWQPVAGAKGYQIFRHEYLPQHIDDLGVPLGENEGGEHVSYLDALRLEPIDYFYSIIPIFDEGQSTQYSTIKLTAMDAIPLSDAVELGIIPIHQKTNYLGKFIHLPAHPLGTDYLGRDLLARLIEGAKTSLFIGVLAPLIFVFLGMLYGGISGFLGGKADEIMMRFVDFIIALPFLLFMILFKVAFGIGPGESGIFPMLMALILLSWPSVARLIRGQVLQLKEMPYIQASKLMGANVFHLTLKHMLPNVTGLLLVTLTFAIPSAIFTEAFLSFIGMGVVPPTPSWGSLCNDGIHTLLTHPHELFFPALFISVTVLAFNLLGDGLRDAFDVKMKEDQR